MKGFNPHVISLLTSESPPSLFFFKKIICCWDVGEKVRIHFAFERRPALKWSEIPLVMFSSPASTNVKSSPLWGGEGHQRRSLATCQSGEGRRPQIGTLLLHVCRETCSRQASGWNLQRSTYSTVWAFRNIKNKEFFHWQFNFII